MPRHGSVRVRSTLLACLLPLLLGADDRKVEVPVDADGGVAVERIVAALADATGMDVTPPDAKLTLPVWGLSGSLGRSVLKDCLGEDVTFECEASRIVFLLPDSLGRADARAKWRGRLERIAAAAREAAARKSRLAMNARPSYRPNDPSRPTVCLVHGLNSSSGGFVHMIPHLEEAGYGIVLFDYAFNQPLDESCAEFRADWEAFRNRVGERLPWAILAHSMGALVARSYVEGPGRDAKDVDSLILIAPVSQGAHVARLQPVLQMVNQYAAVKRGLTTRALAELAQTAGRSADDMLPDSPFLKKINARPRNPAVPYHVISGDVGLLTAEGRKRIEDQVELLANRGGALALLTRAAVGEVAPILDELTDGTGDGAVTVESTKLPGAPDPIVLAASHTELIRAPSQFADPGPVVSMPWVLRWLESDRKGWDDAASRVER